MRKGFDAIGYRPWELEAIAAFLKAHTRHEMSLYLEGEDVRYDAWEIEDEPNPVADVSDATEFVFDDDDFVNAFYAVTCEKCGERVQYGPVRLRAGEPVVLTPPRIDKFLERVRKVERQELPSRQSSARLLQRTGTARRFSGQTQGPRARCRHRRDRVMECCC